MPNTGLVAQLGARLHYAVPRIIEAEGRLDRLVTDICAVKGWPRALGLVPEVARPPGLRRLLDRIPENIPTAKITSFTSFGSDYHRRLTISRSPEQINDTVLWAGQTFCQLVITAGLGAASFVYAFNHAALELLHVARRAGLSTVLEQTIAPRAVERAWLQKECDRFPDWELPAADSRSYDRLVEREAAEWRAADRIICGSEFVRQGIAECGGPVERCYVVPYGVEGLIAPRCRLPRKGPLRVLTVGAVGLRKGSPYVLAAARRLGSRAVFRMVGPIGIRPRASARLRQHVELTGPVARSEMADHYDWADVFLLPSLCEGSALAVSEALRAGRPVITTPNAGSVVRHGLDGFIVSPREVDSMVEAIERFADRPKLLQEMSREAGEGALFDFGVYGKNLCAVLPCGEVKSPRGTSTLETCAP